MMIGLRLKKSMQPHARQLNALAHAHRLAILYLLLHDPRELRDLVMLLKLPPNLIAHHLNILVSADWVVRRKTGKGVRYDIRTKTFRDVRRLLPDTYITRAFFEKGDHGES